MTAIRWLSSKSHRKWPCELQLQLKHILTKGLTCLPRRESEGHDVVYVVGVVGVGRVEGQRSAGSAPQVQQVGGVHHGDRKASLPLPFTDGNILWGSSVVSLSQDPQQSLSRSLQWMFSTGNSLYSVLVSNQILPQESRHTRSWNKGFLTPTWVPQLSDSVLSCQIAPGGLSASCQCPQTEGRRRNIHRWQMIVDDSSEQSGTSFSLLLSHQYVVSPKSPGSSECCLF